MTNLLNAYIEAIYFTEGGPDSPDFEMSELDTAYAHRDVGNFTRAVRHLDLDVTPQMLHDLWLTRNGHGSGFWDRPETYGEHTDTLNAIALAMGPVDLEGADNDD